MVRAFEGLRLSLGLGDVLLTDGCKGLQPSERTLYSLLFCKQKTLNEQWVALGKKATHRAGRPRGRTPCTVADFRRATTSCLPYFSPW